MKGGGLVAREQNERLYEAHYMQVFSYAMTLTGNRMQDGIVLTAAEVFARRGAEK